MLARRDWPMAILAIALGGTIIACSIESGRHRWEDPAWYYASLVPGSPTSWGVVIVAGGLLIAAGARWPRLRRLGYMVLFGWYCFMSAAAALSSYDDLMRGTREADPVEIISWGALAYWCRTSFPARVR